MSKTDFSIEFGMSDEEIEERYLKPAMAKLFEACSERALQDHLKALREGNHFAPESTR